MRSIEQQIKATYFALRLAAAVIAFAFPLLLWGGGKLAGGLGRQALFQARVDDDPFSRLDPDGPCEHKQQHAAR